jgi:hypothetical protein
MKRGSWIYDLFSNRLSMSQSLWATCFLGEEQMEREQPLAASEELAWLEKLLLADSRDDWGKPLTVDELLATGSGAFEAFFQEPPIGPVPEYLIAHLSVYGCVAEYEEKIEELDRWKASQLSRWLKERVGRNWYIAGKVYQLHMKKHEGLGAERFWFTVIEGKAD